MISNKNRRKLRVRNKICKNNKSQRSRVVVYRSNKNINAQLIDTSGNTKVYFSSAFLDNTKKYSGIEKAKLSGIEFAKICFEAKETKVIFDKGSYSYCGRIKVFAQYCRESGIDF